MKKRSSLRTQLIAWNTLTLAVLLGILGLATHLVAYDYALGAVDDELTNRINPPPSNGPPPGPPPSPPNDGSERLFGEPPNGVRDARPDDFGPGDQRNVPQNPNFEGPRGGGSPWDPADFGRGRPPGPGNDEQRPHVFTADGQALRDDNKVQPWDKDALKSAGETTALFTTIVKDSEPYRVATRRLRPGPAWSGPYPVVQAAHSLSDLYRATQALDRGLLALIPLGVIGAWIGATFLTRRVLGRVSRFTLAAEHMGEHDLSKRLPVEGADEFADLAGTFNVLFDRLEDAFQRQAKALEQQRRFTADASHELKTPLTVIKGTSTMAMSHSGTDKRSLAAFSEINQAADGMVRLVHDLLYLAKADSGALGSDKQEVLAMEILENAKSGVSLIEGAPVKFGNVDSDATLYGNEQEMIRLFTNLLSNARRHTPVSGLVQIDLKSFPDRTQLVITDNGSGMSPEHLERLGQRFYRADASRSRDDGGTGLGLAIVKEIVQAHGGTIQFQSSVGTGTAVTVSLPREAPESRG